MTYRPNSISQRSTQVIARSALKVERTSSSTN